jgi:hypothetical protein
MHAGKTVNCEIVQDVACSNLLPKAVWQCSALRCLQSYFLLVCRLHSKFKKERCIDM